jgi:hypothetical protein
MACPEKRRKMADNHLLLTQTMGIITNNEWDTIHGNE